MTCNGSRDFPKFSGPRWDRAASTPSRPTKCPAGALRAARQGSWPQQASERGRSFPVTPAPRRSEPPLTHGQVVDDGWVPPTLTRVRAGSVVDGPVRAPCSLSEIQDWPATKSEKKETWGWGHLYRDGWVNFIALRTAHAPCVHAAASEAPPLGERTRAGCRQRNRQPMLQLLAGGSLSSGPLNRNGPSAGGVRG